MSTILPKCRHALPGFGHIRAIVEVLYEFRPKFDAKVMSNQECLTSFDRPQMSAQIMLSAGSARRATNVGAGQERSAFFAAAFSNGHDALHG